MEDYYDFNHMHIKDNVLIHYFRTADWDVHIPDGITSIGDNCFLCTVAPSELRNVFIPDSVTSIGKLAFYKCKLLHTIRMSNNIQYIGDDAFAGCDIEQLFITSTMREFLQTEFGNENANPLYLCDIEKVYTLDDCGDIAYEAGTANEWHYLNWIIVDDAMIITEYAAPVDCVYIFYDGTETEWNSYEYKNNVGNLWVCFYSETKPETGDNYWYYDNGTPTKWELKI